VSILSAKSEGKCFKTKYRPLTVSAMICFKLKLQLNFTNKRYTSVIANFHTGLCQRVH